MNRIFPDVEELDRISWNAIIASFQDVHILQTWEWGVVKSQFGWQMHPIYWTNKSGEISAAAMLLIRHISIPGLRTRFGILYVPKGPLLKDWTNKETRTYVLNDLVRIASETNAFLVKIDPDIVLGAGFPGETDANSSPLGTELTDEMEKMGWIYSAEQVQFKNTVLLDIAPDEDELLKKMKQKTRYNIRLAGRKGVNVRLGGIADLNSVYRLYAETSIRDGFVIRNEEYYRKVWSTFINADKAKPLIAEVDGEIVAALILFYFAGTAWYLYGMSSIEHRDKMPNYILQWEAIRLAKNMGCSTYDLWGAPEQFDDQDPLWGVYRFKSGLGGTVVRHAGAWDFPVNKSLYSLYTQVLPKILAILRRRGNEETRQLLAT